MSIKNLFADGKFPNIIMIITDQERTIQHWPSTFMTELPAMTQLMGTGLTFENAFTGACMCSPSRATFLTSNYPAVTGVKQTGSPEPAHVLPTTLANLASVLSTAGYKTIVWKGKWHLGAATGPEAYGFSGWDAPDAGTDLNPNGTTLGGGSPDNDGRYLDDILTFLNSATSPFCLVVSLVNPHDVFVGQNGLQQSGYPSDAFSKIPVPLPSNAGENLATKPRAQAAQAWNTQWSNTQQNYVNFYAYLQHHVDRQIQKILNRLARPPALLDDTLVIRFADHGEMGLSHGLVEKFYNAYEETIHIPLIFSNPVVWPSGQTTSAMVSLIDLAPTLASLLGVSGHFTGFKGKDLTPILEEPSASVRSSVHFTYDDLGTDLGPSIIRTIRTAEYTYSVYFVEDGSDADWELYDLAADPYQNTNVAGTEQYGDIQGTLDHELHEHMKHMGTLPSFAWPPKKTEKSRGGPPAVTAR